MDFTGPSWAQERLALPLRSPSLFYCVPITRCNFRFCSLPYLDQRLVSWGDQDILSPQLVCGFQAPAGLLLLSREAYALDFRLVGTACSSPLTLPTRKANQWAVALLNPLVVVVRWGS